MKFEKVFEQMKHGAKAKLPSWSGFWCWDPQKETIMMHTKDGKVLDIRETEVVEYTTMNILSDEWIIADENNCPELGGEATFNFGEAIKYLKRGMKVARKGWNGKRMYLFLGKDIEVYTDANLEEFNEQLDNGKYEATIQESICMRTADKTIVVGWLASQSDMLAEDWVFAE